MKFKYLKNLAYLTQIAFMILTPIIIGIYVGNYLDEKFLVSPICLFFGIILGIGGGFINLFKFIKFITNADKYKSEKDKNE